MTQSALLENLYHNFEQLKDAKIFTDKNNESIKILFKHNGEKKVLNYYLSSITTINNDEHKVKYN